MILVLILALLPTTFAVSQEKLDRERIEARSYELYLNEKWDSLTVYCEEAISYGIDYYYLRMRAGIGYYQLEKYLSSIPHFERALEFQPQDTIAQEYLYYSYLFVNKIAKLNLLASKLPLSLRYRLGYKELRFIDGSYIEVGYGRNGNYNDTKTSFGKTNPKAIESQVVKSGSVYFSFNLLHNLSERVNLFHGVSSLNISKTGQFLDKNKFQEFNLQTQQWSYYITGGGYLGRNFYTNLTLNLLFVNADELGVSQSGTDWVAQKTSLSQNNYIFGFGLVKEVDNFSFGLSNSISNLNDEKQRQTSLDITLYPLSNLNLYLVSNFILHRNTNANGDAIERGLLKAKLGFKLQKKAWLELQYTFGDILNYSEDNSYVVYNVIGKINNLAGANLFLLFSDKVELLLRYTFYIQKAPAYTYNGSIITNYFNEYNHNLIGGLKWKF